jgi:hypothetical protein
VPAPENEVASFVGTDHEIVQNLIDHQDGSGLRSPEDDDGRMIRARHWRGLVLVMRG